MYSPNFYRESRYRLIQKLVEESSLATILTEGRTNLISHLPVLLTLNKDGQPEITSHFARANPHWKELREFGNVKIIFNGPQGYISPAWYRQALDNVPTWNYAVVHASGKFELIDNQSTAFDEMSKFVDYFEMINKTEWKLPSDEYSIMELMKSIVVFKIKDIQFEAKFKLSQKQDSVDRENVIKELSKKINTINLSSYMKKVMDEN